MDKFQIVEKARLLHGPERNSYLKAACDGNDELLQTVLAELENSLHDETIDSGIQRTDTGNDVGQPASQSRKERQTIDETLDSDLHRKDSKDHPPEKDEVDQDLTFASKARDTAADPQNSEHKPTTGGMKHGQWIGDYQLVKPLGQGGMGEVWEAQQFQPVKRVVALKVIRIGISSKEVLIRFEGERQALALMNHQNIARILDAGTTDSGQPFFAMELVSGMTLTEYCDKKELGISDRLKLFIEVCSGIQHAHQKGIIHRDLKPSNILVDHSESLPIPKVIDFGLAKAIESAQQLTDHTMSTSIGQILGTIKYMSPEQTGLKSIDIDTRTDIYSLGIVLYELLTGRPPMEDGKIRGKPLLSVLELICSEEAMKPSSRLESSTAVEISDIVRVRKTDTAKLNRVLAGDLDWIVMKSVEKDRDRRYTSVSELANELQRFLDGEPVQARPPSARYRVSKFVKKNQGLVGTVAAVFAALVAGIAGTTWFAIKANTLQKSEKSLRQVAELKTEEAMELQKSESQAKDLAESRLGDSLASLAKLEVQKGNLANAVLAYEDAIEIGHENEADLRLQKIEAIFSLLQYDKIPAELENLRKLDLTPKQHALSVFFQGLLDKEEGEKLIKQAQELGLPAGYDSMAKACLAKDINEMSKFCEGAISRLPNNSNANKLYFVSLLLQGELVKLRKQAIVVKTLSPADNSVDIVMALVESDPEKRIARLAKVKEVMSPAAYTQLDRALRVATSLQATDAKQASNPIASALKIAKLMTALGAAHREISKSNNSAFGTPIFRIPSIQTISNKFSAGSRKLLFGMSASAKKDFHEINQQIRLADSLYFEAYLATGLLGSEKNPERRKELWTESEELCDLALIASYGLQFETIRSVVMFSKATSQYKLWLEFDDKEAKTRALSSYRELAIRLSRPEETFYKIGDDGLRMIVESCLTLGDDELVATFSDLRLRVSPNSDEAKLHVAVRAAESGDFFKSLDLLNELIDGKSKQSKHAIPIREKVKKDLIEQMKSRSLWNEAANTAKTKILD